MLILMDLNKWFKLLKWNQNKLVKKKVLYKKYEIRCHVFNLILTLRYIANKAQIRPLHCHWLKFDKMKMENEELSTKLFTHTFVLFL